MSNSIHIVINVLDLAFQSHEDVGTEDCLYKSCICRGSSQAAPTNRFVGAAVVLAAPIIPICRGGSV